MYFAITHTWLQAYELENFNRKHITDLYRNDICLVLQCTLCMCKYTKISYFAFSSTSVV